MKKYPDMPVIGIDEAGRGPLAGPVTVAAVIFFSPRDTRLIRGIKDSKRLPKKGRVVWFKKAQELRKNGIIDFAVFSSDERFIDSRGIVFGIQNALGRALKKVCIGKGDALILLDGGLKAPPEYPHQKTIIKGDEKEPAIALASIIAKVTRDGKMVRHARMFPQYGFDIHKGYGTKGHYAALKKYGTCVLHRKSFLTSFNGGDAKRLRSIPT